MDWYEDPSPESQDRPETSEAAEVPPEIQPAAEAPPEPFVEAAPPVAETYIEALPEPLVEVAPSVAETHIEPLPEALVEVAPPVAEVSEVQSMPDSMAATQVSLPTQLLPAAPLDVAHTEPVAEQLEPSESQLVRMPTEVPDMPAAEVPEYPIQETAPVQDDDTDDTTDITQEVAMPRYSPIQERVRALTGAITLYPDAPVNYVLRGELILDLGERQAAREDFLKGLMLAESSADTADWGYVSRALADRARAGLRRCG
jgi:hypothetical protein